MADTTITCTVSPCTVILQTDIPLLNLSAADALQISAAIAGVWAVAWGFRALIRLVSDVSSTTSESE